uniref:Uncharacterized protein n=1 Tax=Knipowitschia caucasica TaxID=637954 RepID=A0AAV2LZ62_KNICA
MPSDSSQPLSLCKQLAWLRATNPVTETSPPLLPSSPQGKEGHYITHGTARKDMTAGKSGLAPRDIPQRSACVQGETRQRKEIPRFTVTISQLRSLPSRMQRRVTHTHGLFTSQICSGHFQPQQQIAPS